MCSCDPNIKTLWCGRGDCVKHPQKEEQVEVKIDPYDILQQLCYSKKDTCIVLEGEFFVYNGIGSFVSSQNRIDLTSLLAEGLYKQESFRIAKIDWRLND